MKHKLTELKQELVELKARQNRYKNIGLAITLVDNLEDKRIELKRIIYFYKNYKVLNLTEAIIAMVNNKIIYHIDTNKSYTWSLEKHSVEETDLYLMKKDGYIVKD